MIFYHKGEQYCVPFDWLEEKINEWYNQALEDFTEALLEEDVDIDKALYIKEKLKRTKR